MSSGFLCGVPERTRVRQHVAAGAEPLDLRELGRAVRAGVAVDSELAPAELPDEKIPLPVAVEVVEVGRGMAEVGVDRLAAGLEADRLLEILGEERQEDGRDQGSPTRGRDGPYPDGRARSGPGRFRPESSREEGNDRENSIEQNSLPADQVIPENLRRESGKERHIRRRMEEDERQREPQGSPPPVRGSESPQVEPRYQRGGRRHARERGERKRNAVDSRPESEDGKGNRGRDPICGAPGKSEERSAARQSSSSSIVYSSG